MISWQRHEIVYVRVDDLVIETSIATRCCRGYDSRDLEIHGSMCRLAFPAKPSEALTTLSLCLRWSLYVATRSTQFHSPTITFSTSLGWFVDAWQSRVGDDKLKGGLGNAD